MSAEIQRYDGGPPTSSSMYETLVPADTSPDALSDTELVNRIRYVSAIATMACFALGDLVLVARRRGIPMSALSADSGVDMLTLGGCAYMATVVPSAARSFDLGMRMIHKIIANVEEVDLEEAIRVALEQRWCSEREIISWYTRRKGVNITLTLPSERTKARENPISVSEMMEFTNAIRYCAPLGSIGPTYALSRRANPEDMGVVLWEAYRDGVYLGCGDEAEMRHLCMTDLSECVELATEMTATTPMDVFIRYEDNCRKAHEAAALQARSVPAERIARLCNALGVDTKGLLGAIFGGEFAVNSSVGERMRRMMEDQGDE